MLYACVDIMLCNVIFTLFTAQASSDVIHIGIGDIAQETPENAQLSPCASLPAATAFQQLGPHVCQCQPGASGRYVYVYIPWYIQALSFKTIKVYGADFVGT